MLTIFYHSLILRNPRWLFENIHFYRYKEVETYFAHFSNTPNCISNYLYNKFYQNLFPSVKKEECGRRWSFQQLPFYMMVYTFSIHVLIELHLKTLDMRSCHVTRVLTLLQQYCRQHGGRLVHVEDERENNFLKDQLRERNHGKTNLDTSRITQTILSIRDSRFNYIDWSDRRCIISNHKK